LQRQGDRKLGITGDICLIFHSADTPLDESSQAKPTTDMLVGLFNHNRVGKLVQSLQEIEIVSFLPASLRL